MHDENERLLMQIRGAPAKTMTNLEAMMDPTNPNVFEANDNDKRISELEAENQRLREALSTALEHIETNYSAEAIKSIRAALSQEEP